MDKQNVDVVPFAKISADAHGQSKLQIRCWLIKASTQRCQTLKQRTSYNCIH